LPLVESDGRVHCQLDPLGTETGRFACREPNLHSLPRPLRDLVIPADDHVLVSADLSQFELRVLTHCSQDENLLAVYRDGNIDVHRRTAALIFEKQEEAISAEERDLGKRLNFAVVYGMTNVGLADRLGIAIERAEELIDAYATAYPDLVDWIGVMGANAEQQQAIRTQWGRRRTFPDGMTARRTAVNSIVQGTAADLFKLLLRRLWDEMPQSWHLVLPIHDAVLVEAPADDAEAAVEQLRELMERPVDRFSVPLVAEVKQGSNWAACK
jgi:DNA polymerase-1